MISEETKNKWDEKISFCIENQDYLSAWELVFISSIFIRRGNDLDLNHTQLKNLNEIFDNIKEKVN